jgi:hypothetical protein
MQACTACPVSVRSMSEFERRVMAGGAWMSIQQTRFQFHPMPEISRFH